MEMSDKMVDEKLEAMRERVQAIRAAIEQPSRSLAAVSHLCCLNAVPKIDASRRVAHTKNSIWAAGGNSSTRLRGGPAPLAQCSAQLQAQILELSTCLRRPACLLSPLHERKPIIRSSSGPPGSSVGATSQMRNECGATSTRVRYRDAALLLSGDSGPSLALPHSPLSARHGQRTSCTSSDQGQAACRAALVARRHQPAPTVSGLVQG